MVDGMKVFESIWAGTGIGRANLTEDTARCRGEGDVVGSICPKAMVCSRCVQMTFDSWETSRKVPTGHHLCPDDSYSLFMEEGK